MFRELEQADLVEYRDGDWYSTQSGRLACRAHRNYLDQLDNLGDVSSVLDFMDTDEEVSWAFIEGADTLRDPFEYSGRRDDYASGLC